MRETVFPSKLPFDNLPLVLIFFYGNLIGFCIPNYNNFRIVCLVHVLNSSFSEAQIIRNVCPTHVPKQGFKPQLLRLDWRIESLNIMHTILMTMVNCKTTIQKGKIGIVIILCNSVNPT